MTQTVSTTLAKRAAHTEQPDKQQIGESWATEATAYASIAMAVAAFVTIVVTAVGTYLIWTQVKLTRKAVMDTASATEAMREANMIAKQNAAPYFELEGSVRLSSFQAPLQHYVIVDIRNRGQTHAARLNVSCEMEIANGIFPKAALPLSYGNPITNLVPQEGEGLRFGEHTLAFSADQIRGCEGVEARVWFTVNYTDLDEKLVSETRKYAGIFVLDVPQIEALEYPYVNAVLNWAA